MTETQVELSFEEAVNARRQRISDALMWLCETFPRTFSATEIQRPLKIGIYRDITAYKEVAPTVHSNTTIRRALRQYTKTPAYLRRVLAGTQRIALDGTAAGIVTEHQQMIAAQRLTRVEAKLRKQEKLRAQEEGQCI